jgi:hypothetical protein
MFWTGSEDSERAICKVPRMVHEYALAGAGECCTRFEARAAIGGAYRVLLGTSCPILPCLTIAKDLSVHAGNPKGVSHA